VIVVGYGSDVEKVVPTLYPYRAKTQVFFREDGGQDPRLLLVGPSFPEETSWGSTGACNAALRRLVKLLVQFCCGEPPIVVGSLSNHR
jgi:hypothetical protein